MDPARIRRALSLKDNFRSIFHRPAERYATVDGLRALSMLWVVLTHLALSLSRGMPYDAYVRLMDRAPWMKWVMHGEKALDTFFVISGFLIGLMLLGEHAKTGKIDLGRFYARRYLRLMPAYGVALAVLWALHVQGPDKDPYVWANILYVNNFLPQRHMFMDWSWSLAVEEQFYLCLPIFLLAVFLRSKRPLPLLAACCGLALAVRAFVLYAHPHVAQVGFGEHFIVCAPHYSEEYFDAMYVNLATRFFPFVVGLGLAWAVVSREPELRGALAHPGRGDMVLALGVVLLALVLAVPAFDPHVDLPRPALWTWIWCARSVWSIGVALVMAAVLFPSGALSRLAARLLANRAWFPVAQLSYCGYLFHLAFILPSLFLTSLVFGPRTTVLGELLGAMDSTRLFFTYALVLAFTFLSGATMYLAVERPFLNMRPR